MWVTIIGIKFGSFPLKHTLHAMVIFLSYGNTCFDRRMHCAFLHVCLYIMECSVFTIHCSLKFYGSGMWSRALGFQGSL
jgi:hypothetical protein